MLEILNRKIFHSKINICKSDVINVDCADRLPNATLQNVLLVDLPGYLVICVSTIGNYCITGRRHHYEYYKTRYKLENRCVSI